MSTFYVMEAVNLFCGNDDPSKSKHLTISELKLPEMTEKFEDHNPGGGRVGIEVSVGIEKLVASFKLNGFDPDLLAQFGLGKRTSNNYTAYGSIVEKRSGKTYQAKAVMEGRLGKVAPDAFQRGELQGHEYGIHGITRFELFFDGEEKVAFDFYANTWRIDGVDQNAEMNRNLGL